MLPVSNVKLEEIGWNILEGKNCTAAILRLDEIHPVVSGNKWFKLKYHIQDAIAQNKKTMLTFGGAYSNHIIATAFAAKMYGLQSIGIIRGEQPATLSTTLEFAREYGMQLIFVSRDSYKNKQQDEHIKAILQQYKDVYIVAEGGAGPLGVKGCEEILSLTPINSYTHILCAMGTGTMYNGLLNSAIDEQQVIGIPVLKGMQQEFAPFMHNRKARFMYDYHFGGYAKKTPELLSFMNDFYDITGVPTDFVYTGKLMFAFSDLLKKDYFKQGSRILLIHSGGMQGNNSLSSGTLAF